MFFAAASCYVACIFLLVRVMLCSGDFCSIVLLLRVMLCSEGCGGVDVSHLVLEDLHVVIVGHIFVVLDILDCFKMLHFCVWTAWAASS